MTFGERLKSRRRELGLTQQELADTVGLKKASISGLELGTSKNPSAENLLPLASALNVNPEWLLTGRGPKVHGTPAGRPSLHEIVVALEEMARERAGIGDRRIRADALTSVMADLRSDLELAIDAAAMALRRATAMAPARHPQWVEEAALQALALQEEMSGTKLAGAEREEQLAELRRNIESASMVRHNTGGESQGGEEDDPKASNARERR